MDYPKRSFDVWRHIFVFGFVMTGLYVIGRFIPPPPTKSVLDIPVARNVLEPTEDTFSVTLRPEQYEAGVLPKVLTFKAVPEIKTKASSSMGKIEEENGWWRIRIADVATPHTVVFTIKPAKVVFSSYEQLKGMP